MHIGHTLFHFSPLVSGFGSTAFPQSVIFDVFVFDLNIGQCLESGLLICY